MSLEGYTVKQCRERIAYEFKPKKKQIISLSSAEEAFKSKYTIQATTPFMMIGRHKGRGFSIFSNGKILIKGVKERKEAEELAEQLVETLKKAKKGIKYMEMPKHSLKDVQEHRTTRQDL